MIESTCHSCLKRRRNLRNRKDQMTRQTFHSLIRTEFDNGYAISFIAIVVLSALLFVFNLLGAYDPAVLALPEWYAKFIYTLGGLSGIAVYVGMFMGYLSFKNRWESTRIKKALIIEIIGLSIHIAALIMLAASTIMHPLQALWIAPTSLFLAVPHIQLQMRLIAELAKFDYKEQQYNRALELIDR